MEKILLLTHGGWGQSLKKSVEMILGKIDFVDEVALLSNDLLDEYRERVQNKIESEKKEAEAQGEKLQLTILTDMFGGTTTNVAAMEAHSANETIHVITGLNSVVLIEACAQIMNQKHVDIKTLIENSHNSIFDVMEKVYRKGE